MITATLGKRTRVTLLEFFIDNVTEVVSYIVAPEITIIWFGPPTLISTLPKCPSLCLTPWKLLSHFSRVRLCATP